MKTFVYNKSDNKVIAVLKDIITCVDVDPDTVTFVGRDGTAWHFDKHKVKTTSYQN